MQLTNKKHSNKGVGLYSVLLVLLCCCTALFALAGPALSATISGTVSLPNGDSPPSNGSIYVDIYIRTATGVGYGYGSGGQSTWYDWQSVEISQTTPQPTYTFSVSDDQSLSFEVSYLAYGSNYFPEGFFQDSTHTTWTENNGTAIPGGGDHNDINLTLIPTKTINGKLSLPTGDTAPDDMCFTIKTKSNQGVVKSGVRILHNESQGNYSVKIPDDSTLAWKISYDNLQSCDFFFPEDYPYWGVGLYNTSATVLHETDASQLNGGDNHADINMTVFAGNSITGTIALPDNTTATGDMKVFVRAEITGSSTHSTMKEGFGYGYGTPMTYEETSVYNTVTIRQGQSSKDYTLTISPEAGVTWKVSYTCFEGCDDYSSPGFYNTSATTGSLTNASPLAGAADHSGINLTLLKQKKGMLCFPVRSKDGQISIISM